MKIKFVKLIWLIETSVGISMHFNETTFQRNIYSVGTVTVVVIHTCNLIQLPCVGGV